MNKQVAVNPTNAVHAKIQIIPFMSSPYICYISPQYCDLLFLCPSIMKFHCLCLSDNGWIHGLVSCVSAHVVMCDVIIVNIVCMKYTGINENRHRIHPISALNFVTAFVFTEQTVCWTMDYALSRMQWQPVFKNTLVDGQLVVNIVIILNLPVNGQLVTSLIDHVIWSLQ